MRFHRRINKKKMPWTKLEEIQYLYVRYRQRMKAKKEQQDGCIIIIKAERGVGFKEEKRSTVSDSGEKQPGNLASQKLLVILNAVVRTAQNRGAADTEDCSKGQPSRLGQRNGRVFKIGEIHYMLMRRVQVGESREQSSQEGGGLESGTLMGRKGLGTR